MTITAGARSLLFGLTLILFAVAGCGNGSESEPPKQPAVLRKKIAMPKKQPPQAVKPEERVAKEKVSETKEQPQQAVKPEEGETKEKVSETKTATKPPLQQAKAEPLMPEKKPMVQRAKTSPKLPAEQAGKQPSEQAGKQPLYSPKGKTDPFQPLFATESQRRAPAGKGGKKEKRPPLTPLQRLDLGQLKLVGIIVSPSGNKAIVEEPSGKGYVITTGTYIGRNFGRVKQILYDRVIIEEHAEGFAWDELIPQTTELRLQKRSGNV